LNTRDSAGEILMSGFTFNDDKLCFDDLDIFLLSEKNTKSDYKHRDDVLYMEKSAPYIRSYEKIKTDFAARKKPVSNVLEIGIFRGGSAPFLHRLFDAQRVVCVDIQKEPVIPLETYRQRHHDAITTRYGIDQADRPAMTQVLEAEFRAPLDLVVDDASHLYEQTKTTFETVFPYLNPGGIYVIEDWSWAHESAAQHDGDFYWDKAALTNLIFELIILHGGDRGIIDYLSFDAGLMWARKGWKSLPKGDFRLADHAPKRGRMLAAI